MRVIMSMYYDSIYGSNNSKLNKELFDVNKQIASGLKIQYAKDGVRTFAETMRLDNEVAVLDQIKQSTESGYKVANQTDEIMNGFNTSLNRMRTLLLQASNGTNDDISLDSIADELREIEKNLKGLANTSINGQFLFSGSAIEIKPIADDGVYQGNDDAMNSFTGSNNLQQYNLSGSDLFLGEEVLRNREVTSNTLHGNLLVSGKSLSPSTALRELMGDKDNSSATVNTDYFYLRGTKSDGSAIKEKIVLNDTATIDTLLKRIGVAYGNTGTVDVVAVSMNDNGQIVVKDKIKGSSKLDFHLVGAVDYSGAGAANVNDIDNLDSGETTYPPAGDLYVKEFMQSGLIPANGAATNIQGLIYDRTEFSKDGFYLASNTAQVTKSNNAFAAPSTKISEVADLTQGNLDTLDGSSLSLTGTDVNGIAYDVTINFFNTANSGSTFTDNITGNTYNIFNMDSVRTAVNADDMTYQQLLDVVNMVATGIYPATNTATDYDNALKSAQLKGDTYLSYDGKVSFHDLQGMDTNGTLANISLYDPNSNDFTAGATSSIMTFNTNNALTISDPKTDFFKTVDAMIVAVEDHKLYPDSSSGNIRNVGIENAIQKMDDLQDHVLRMHSKIGAQSNTLNMSLERIETLKISTMSLRSSVLDTDLAESSLALQQLTINYKAMLSTVGMVSKLSLVNYL